MDISNNLSKTSFIGDEIYQVLRDATYWLEQVDRVSGRKHSFYFSQLVQSYDSELGYCVEIYHSEIGEA